MTNLRYRALKVWRYVTADLRLLPDFLVIGVQKGGTTSLLQYLAQHPCIARSLRKEVHYFDLRSWKGLRWYRLFFPTRITKELVKVSHHCDLRVGEASPEYLLHPVAASRAHQTVPEARLIALFRNPVDRAYSQYNVSLARGYETLSFEEAINGEEQRLEGEEHRLVEDARHDPQLYYHHSYLRRGHYAEQLQRWLDYYPRDQLLILRSEDLFADPAAVTNEVTDFLGVPRMELRTYDRFNPGKYESGMTPETRRHLIEYFRPYNQCFYELVGRDFGWEN